MWKDNKQSNDVLAVVWWRGQWKSLLTTIFIWSNPDVTFYVNYNTTSENAIKCKSLEEMLRSVKKSEVDRKCVVIDEAQKLFNSRAFQSSKNMWLVKFIVESRKFGADVIVIAQVFDWIDKQVRQQVDYVVEMLPIEHAGDDVNLNVLIKKRVWVDENSGDGLFQAINILKVNNAVRCLSSMSVEYDTNESLDF